MSHASRAAAGAVAAVLALTTLSGCAPRVLESDGGLLVVVASEDNGMEALIVGELTTTAGGCLGVRSEESEGVTMLAVPPGTTLSGDDAVVMPVYGRLVLGDQVSLGGGGGDLERWAEWVDVPSACADEPGVFLVNALR